MAKYVPPNIHEDKDNWLRRAGAFDEWELSCRGPMRLFALMLRPFFNIYNWVLGEIEDLFAPRCKWCGRNWFTKANRDACCADKKAEYGPNPWTTTCNSYGSPDGGVTSGFDGSEKYYYDGTDKYYPR